MPFWGRGHDHIGNFNFNVEIEGLGVASGFSMSKAVYDWVAIKGSSKPAIDGLDKASAATGPSGASCNAARASARSRNSTAPPQALGIT